MNFNKGRMAKLAGLLREGVYADEGDEGAAHETYETYEAEEPEEAEEAYHAEADDVEETYEVDEAGLKELEESFDLRRVIRDEISKAIRNRDSRTYEWTTGQVHGRKSSGKAGAVTMGFPGIGFRR